MSAATSGRGTGSDDGTTDVVGASPLLETHLASLAAALLAYRGDAVRLAHWGGQLARCLTGGGRLLVAGNGGSAAQAQHLAAELVGKLHEDRRPFSAIALCADSSAVTAIGNDYGFDETFARQVRAHGRPGDILLLLSTSGRSANLVRAARAGQELGLCCWALTGPAPNPLAELCTEFLAVASADTQVVQELHLLSAHVLCDHLEAALPPAASTALTVPAGATGPVPDAASGGVTGPGAGVPGDTEAVPAASGVDAVPAGVTAPVAGAVDAVPPGGGGRT